MQFFHAVTTEEITQELDAYKERIIQAENDRYSQFNKNNLKKSGFLQEFGLIQTRLEVIKQVEAGPSGITPYWARKFVDKSNWIGKNFSYSRSTKELVVAIRDALQSLPGCSIVISSKGYETIGQVVTVFIQRISFPMFLSTETNKLLQYAERFLGEENELPFSPYYKGLLTTRGFRLIEQIDCLMKSFNYRAKGIKKSENYTLKDTLFHYTITIGSFRGGGSATLVPMEETPETLRDLNWIVLKEGDTWSVKPEQRYSPREAMRLLEGVRNLGAAGYESSTGSFIFHKDPRAELSRAKYSISVPNRSFIGIEDDQFESSFKFCSTLQSLSNQFFQKVFEIVSQNLETLGVEEINSEAVVLTPSQNEEMTSIVGEYIVLSELYHTREIVESEPLRDFDHCYYNCLEFINNTLSNFNLRTLSSFNVSSETVKLALTIFVRNVFPGVLLDFINTGETSDSDLDWNSFSISIMSSPQEIINNSDEHNNENLLGTLRDIIKTKRVLPTDSVRFTSYGFKLVKSLAILLSSFITIRFGSPYISSLASVKITLGSSKLRFIKTSGYDYSNIIFGDEHNAIPKYEEVFETTKKALWDNSHHSTGTSEVEILRASGVKFTVRAVNNDINKNVWIVTPDVDEGFTGYDTLLQSFKQYGCTHYNESVHGFIFTRNPAEFLNTNFKWQEISNRVEETLGVEETLDREAKRISSMMMQGSRFKGLKDYSTGSPLPQEVETEKGLSTNAEILKDFDTISENLSFNSDTDNDEWTLGDEAPEEDYDDYNEDVVDYDYDEQVPESTQLFDVDRAEDMSIEDLQEELGN